MVLWLQLPMPRQSPEVRRGRWGVPRAGFRNGTFTASAHGVCGFVRPCAVVAVR